MNISLSVMDPYHYDCDFAIIDYNNNKQIEIPLFTNGGTSSWGAALACKCSEEKIEFINDIELAWTCLEENASYHFHLENNEIINLINSELIHNNNETLILGIAPGGHVSIWVNSGEEQKLLYASKNFLRTCNDSQDIHSSLFNGIYNDVKIRTRQYNFKPYLWPNKAQEPIVLGSISIKGFDGSVHAFVFSNNNYCFCGIPQKLIVKFQIGKNGYQFFFWFQLDYIYMTFNRFYGAHPETKTDFIIRIDAEKKKYELALYRQGLKEPVVIPKSAYQLIVFKNKFEDYRSENYNQPRGAWIW